jgi:predicted deacylase
VLCSSFLSLNIQLYTPEAAAETQVSPDQSQEDPVLMLTAVLMKRALLTLEMVESAVAASKLPSAEMSQLMNI